MFDDWGSGVERGRERVTELGPRTAELREASGTLMPCCHTYGSPVPESSVHVVLTTLGARHGEGKGARKRREPTGAAQRDRDDRPTHG